MHSKKNRFSILTVILFLFISFNLFLSYQFLIRDSYYTNSLFRLVREAAPSISQRAETARNLLLSILEDKSKTTSLLQYGVTTGYETLRRQVANILAGRGIEANYEDNISIFNGRDDMLDTLARILINPGDTVFVYTNSDLSDKAIGHFQHHDANILGCDTLNELRNSIEDVKKNNQFYNNGNHSKAKFIYADSSCMSEDEVIALKQLAEENGLFIIEDATAVEVGSDYASNPNIKALDDNGTVIYMGNLDSVLGKGLQTSYIVGANGIMRKLEWAKGAQTLHPNSFAQVLISEYLKEQLGVEPQGKASETEEYSSNLDYFLSKTGKELNESAIRGILKITQRPEVISLAGGIPAAEFFPKDKLIDIIKNMTPEEWSMSLDRITPVGHSVLRETIADWLENKGIEVNTDEVLVTSGSQSALDIIARVLNRMGEENATIFTPAPVYLGAANAFKAAGCDVRTYNTDTLEDLRNKLNKMSKGQLSNTVIYLTPTFSNPAGDVISLEKREEYLKIAQEYKIKIIEDNPYGELRYDGKKVSTIKSLDEEGNTVIYLTSNSKVFSPGMRIGYIIGNKGLIDGLTNFKNTTFGVSNSMVQVIIAKFLTDKEFNLDNHVNEVLIPNYTKRKNAMRDALEEAKEVYDVNIEYTPSKGGLFVWVKLPDVIDTEELLVKTAGEEYGVEMGKTMEEYAGEKIYAAFVPGGPFGVEKGSYSNYMRLCFSTRSEQDIRKAVLAIMQAVRYELNEINGI